MTSSPPPEPRQSFGRQAARFSLYAPFVAITIGVFGQRALATGGAGSSAARVGLAWVSVALLVAGLVLGVFALATIRRNGMAGILARAASGVVLNGLFLVAIGAMFASAARAGNVRAQAVGHWSLRSTPKVAAATTMPATTLALNGDGTFALDVGAAESVGGRWVFTADRVIALTIERVSPGGDPKAVGRQVGLGRVKQVGAATMTLGTDAGDEVYAREP